MIDYKEIETKYGVKFPDYSGKVQFSVAVYNRLKQCGKDVNLVRFNQPPAASLG